MPRLLIEQPCTYPASCPDAPILVALSCQETGTEASLNFTKNGNLTKTDETNIIENTIILHNCMLNKPVNKLSIKELSQGRNLCDRTQSAQ